MLPVPDMATSTRSPESTSGTVIGTPRTTSNAGLSSFSRRQSKISAVPKTSFSNNDGIPDPRMLGRRMGTTLGFASGEVDQTEALACSDDGGPGTLTNMGKVLHKIRAAPPIIRYTFFVIPGTVLLAVPIIVTDKPPDDIVRIDGIRLMGLFIWVEIIWLGLWLSKLIAHFLPILLQATYGLISTGVRKYPVVLKAIQYPIWLLIWTICCFGSTDVIVVFDKTAYYRNDRGEWVRMLKKGTQIAIVAATIFFVEKIIIQLISINYYRRSYARKIRESQRLIYLLELLYDASRELFPEFGKDFVHEDSDIQNAEKGIITRARDKAAAAMHSGSPPARSIVSKALDNETASKALARRLWLSLCASGKDAITREDIVEALGEDKIEEIDEIFDILDRDGNGDVSLEEMTTLIIDCGSQRRDRASSIQDISVAISVLDKILTIIVIIIAAIIFALTFSKAFSARAPQLLAGTASLAFAIGGTVTEFFACCIFLFVKHPYDVGDRVTIDKQELIVKHINLMYSIFKRVDNHAVVQIPHNIANTLWIGNTTRSKAMTERVKVKVCFSTSTEAILALRKEMEKFVNAPENCRDFQPDFDIEITSLENLFAIELRVEIRYKSNCTNEALRLYRRNKFMCELSDAFRRIPIERPGGNYGPSNPTYTCELSNEEALDWQKVKKEQVAATKLYGNDEEAAALFPYTAGGSAAQAMFPGLKRRTPHSAADTGRRLSSV